VATPRPGRPSRGSRSGRPIMALLDLLGRRWALRVLWELRGGPLTFRGLRARCDEMSPSVLNTRLRELREAQIIDDRNAAGYELTQQGRDLLRALEPINEWANAWTRKRR
jgi:DNA-binding HxlR family transcriptional regulator